MLRQFIVDLVIYLAIFLKFFLAVFHGCNLGEPTASNGVVVFFICHLPVVCYLPQAKFCRCRTAAPDDSLWQFQIERSWLTSVYFQRRWQLGMAASRISGSSITSVDDFFALTISSRWRWRSASRPIELVNGVLADVPIGCYKCRHGDPAHVNTVFH